MIVNVHTRTIALCYEHALNTTVIAARKIAEVCRDGLNIEMLEYYTVLMQANYKAAETYAKALGIDNFLDIVNEKLKEGEN